MFLLSKWTNFTYRVKEVLKKCMGVQVCKYIGVQVYGCTSVRGYKCKGVQV